jgi:serine/threonine protein kinase
MWFFNGQRNFAELFGYCVDPWIIIMRYYEFGSLQGLIHEQSKHENLESVRFTHRLARQLATDIAMGLNEMHINGFAHADVKSANILLDLDKHQNRLFAVLTDFGIANVVGEKPLLVRGFRVNDNNGGSFAYAGPEVLDRLLANPPRNVNEFPRAQQLSTAADTYAFAIIIYELLTRLYPWKELGSLNDLHKCVKEGERPSLTSEIRRLLDTNDDVTTLYRVMVKCWHGDPFARPKMTAVLNQLRNK